jgi:NADPH:quinone reductase-like Zn-dependent oxidoreductase
MRAVRIHRYGPPEVLQIEDVPEPRPGPRDLRVRIRATSVNPIDWKIRAGGQRGVIWYSLPWILGLDFSGEVVEVGSKVRGFAVGDEVFGSPTHRRPGTYAEQFLVDERLVARKPARLSHTEAAALPLAGLTAWQALVKTCEVKAGDRVLIHAAAGGVGTLAIQIAKARGAWVAGTASAGNHALLRELGVDLAIDYHTERFEDVAGPIDVVLDSVGGETRARSLAMLKPGARIASIAAGLPKYTERSGPFLGALQVVLEVVGFTIGPRLRGIRAAHVTRWPSGPDTAAMAELVESGQLRPIIDRVLPLSEIVEAHRYSETGRARGKIVLEV